MLQTTSPIHACTKLRADGKPHSNEFLGDVWSLIARLMEENDVTAEELAHRLHLTSNAFAELQSSSDLSLADLCAIFEVLGEEPFLGRKYRFFSA